MLIWASLFLFAASGSAPSYKMWYAEQYPTRIRAVGQTTVEGLGGRLLGGVVWTFLFPIFLKGFGLKETMVIVAVASAVALVIVTIFAPETAGRRVEDLEAEVVTAAAEEPAEVRLRVPG
jgi:putative MFS transporter